jgi:hypothetical protein
MAASAYSPSQNALSALVCITLPSQSPRPKTLSDLICQAVDPKEH